MTDSKSNRSRKELLDELRRLGEVVGPPPSTADMNEHGEYSHQPYYWEFGDWETALRKAGFEPNSQQSKPSLRLSETQLISHLQEVAEDLGHPPSAREMRKFGDHAKSTYQQKFGSWNKALKIAGLEPQQPPVEEREANSIKSLHQSESWKDLRRKVIEEVGGECERCGISDRNHREKYGVGLNVHHITPVGEFDDAQDANTRDNLQVLCAKCHGLVEQGDQ